MNAPPADILSPLAGQIDRHTLQRDRFRLRRRLRALQSALASGGTAPEPVEALISDIDRSAGRFEARRSLVPAIISYPPELPVSERRGEIADAIREHQVIVLCGETGSGKTTQLPKICLELGRGIAGKIGHTQPRRVAARSVAARLASELGVQLGRQVGYKVRFGDKTSPDTLVKLVTDGMLLAELEGDRFLDEYDTLIIDEAHERSLNIDFLLGTLHTLLPRRPDLKLIITSATIDPVRFSRHFGDAPIVEVSGRTYPVEARYRPLMAQDPEEEDLTQIDGILAAVEELWQDAPGDILIFLPGEREIRQTAEALQARHPPDVEILPLFARLSADEQDRVFKPHQRKRIVLATNVAETSLTVPGIRYVIDPGFARISRYSARNKVQRLHVERISQASADQRKGRCGRIAPGICIRLYSEEDFLGRPEFTEPEILRTNLAAVILQMKAQRLGDVQSFPFIEPPDYRQVKDGYQTLSELGAVDAGNQLTDLGRRLARLPVDPRLARMLLEGVSEGCLAEMIVVASALSVIDPRERPIDQQPAADAAHGQWKDPQSDFIGLLKLWGFFREQHQNLSGSKLRKACKQNFLSYLRMREWADVQSQLTQLAGEMGWRTNSRPAGYDETHRAVLAGLLANIGQKGDKHEYEGARGAKFSLFPGSGLFGRSPRWVVAAEIVHTTRLYARTNAMIHPEWVERLAEHLVKRTHFEPHWVRATAHVAAFERVSLYGLVIVPRRRVHYGPIDPKTSREIFIQSALVEGDYDTNAPWRRHNDALIAELELLQTKRRSVGLLTDNKSRFAFFDARIPADVYSGPLFEQWRRDAEKGDRRLLHFDRKDLLADPAAPLNSDAYPDRLTLGETAVSLEYRHDVADPQDGVTAVIPLPLLAHLDPEPFEWLVPGMLPEKITELIRTLPRPVRTKLVPAPEFASRALPLLDPANGPLASQLARALGRLSGESIVPADFRPDALPDHLRMNVRVTDDAGRTLSFGRDVPELRRGLAQEIRKIIAETPTTEFRRDGIRSWDFGDLPEQVEIRRPGALIRGYPTLADEGNSVSLRLADTPDAARHGLRAGVRRLFLFEFRDEMSSQLASLRELPRLSIAYARLRAPQELKAQVRTVIADRLLYGDEGLAPIRTRAAFQDALGRAWTRVRGVAVEVESLVADVLDRWQETSLALSSPVPPLLQPSVQEMQLHLAALVHPAFLTATPYVWLKQYPRYVRAIGVRLEKLRNAGLPRDRAAQAEVVQLLTDYRRQAERLAAIGLPADPDLALLRWMIEEYRVSLFAQELRTTIPISAHRIESQLARVKARR